MDDNSGEKSRQERRKEARLTKNKKKFDSWIQHQKLHKLKNSSRDSNNLKKSHNLFTGIPSEREVFPYKGDQILEQHTLLKSSEVKLGSSGFPDSSEQKVGKEKKSKTKFEEYLKMDMQEGVGSAKEDLKLERKLAKKLKVKDGKLGGVNDDINMFLERIPSVLDSLLEETTPRTEEDSQKSFEKGSSCKKSKKSKPLVQELEGEIAADTMVGPSGPGEICCDSDHITKQLPVLKKSKVQLDSSKILSSTASKMAKRKKTKFEEYLEMSMQEGVVSAQEDLKLERKLAKKLKVKDGKLGEADDGIKFFFEGIPSVLDSFENEEMSGAEEAPKKTHENSSSHKKHKKMKLPVQKPDVEIPGDTEDAVSEPLETFGVKVAPEKVPAKSTALGGTSKYVAPHLRARVGNESEEYLQIRRLVRGLLNRLSESNVESITGEVFTIFRSLGRSVGCQIISEEILASCSGGPRGNEQYAAVFAAFVTGMACLVGIDFGAKLLGSLAKCFEDEYLEEDNLSLRNLTLLLSYLYIFGVCSSDLIYDFMLILSKRLMEIDVSTILTILQCCGMKLRGDDPATLKNFILSVQNTANELKVSSGDGEAKTSSKRMEFMLETICDIKNNKKRPKEDSAHHTRIKKWLQKLRVEDVLIRGLKWNKLLDPDKKGQWWLSGDMTSTIDNVGEVASTIDKDTLEAQKMLQLAAAQRMNTDARKAIFCIIMTGEDYIDAFEKLLRLDLPGKQDREVMRVLVECCLQEKVFNKYYSVLAAKLCSHDKNHKFTLQYCLWDHFRELESMQLIRSMHLSKFVAEMVASFTLSLSVLKGVDFRDTAQLTPKRIMHFRMLFEAIFDYSDSLIWNIFTRIAVTPDYESLRNGIVFFVNKYVASSKSSLAKKVKVVKKALNNLERVIL